MGISVAHGEHAGAAGGAGLAPRNEAARDRAGSELRAGAAHYPSAVREDLRGGRGGERTVGPEPASDAGRDAAGDASLSSGRGAHGAPAARTRSVVRTH